MGRALCPWCVEELERDGRHPVRRGGTASRASSLLEEAHGCGCWTCDRRRPDVKPPTCDHARVLVGDRDGVPATVYARVVRGLCYAPGDLRCMSWRPDLTVPGMPPEAEARIAERARLASRGPA